MTVTEQDRDPRTESCGRLLSDLFGGDHHVEWRRVKAEPFGQVSYTTSTGFATFDSDLLTRLVVMAHERHIRAEVLPGGPGRIKLWLSQRRPDGPMYERHPGMERFAAHREAAVAPLVAFAADLLRDYPDLMLDGADIHEAAVLHGLLVAEQRTEFCGECCNCAEYHGDPAGGFTCYRLRDDIAALAKAKEGL